MQKHFGMLVFVCSLTLPGCGSADRGPNLTTLSAALECQSDDDCGAGSACRAAAKGAYCESTETAPPGPAAPPACTYDSDCAAGEECEQEHGSAYCKPHHDDDYGHDDYAPGDDSAHHATDAGAPDGGVSTCSDDDSYDRTQCEDDHHGGSYADPPADTDDDDDDRRGSNSGHH